MIISLIAAMADNRVIGIENRLPWNLPADMKWFRQHTLGKPVLMGRKTFESIGKPLPNRTNIVVTRDAGWTAAGCVVVKDIDAALRAASDAPEVMVIGGASFYAQMLPKAQRLYLTLVHTEIEGDAWFPEINFAEWREIERHDYPADEVNGYPYSFVIYQR
ncbi:MAG: type 3 dihydrofolate reductase [Gammaproteobacteria bacterium]|nr:type 3 dihydrofolate reductase [Gammaproteobacteria bacterium]